MKRALALAIAVWLPSDSWAAAFKILGVRPLGMGGAYVGVAEGPLAPYWNPGSLAVTGGVGVTVPVGVSFEATGDILQKADAIASLAGQVDDIQNKQITGGALTLQQVRDFNDGIVRLTDLNKGGTGALVGVSGGANVRVKRIAVSFNNFTDVSGAPFVDTKFDLGAIAGAGGISLNGDAALNDAADAAARDQIASVIGNMVSSFGLTIGAGFNSTTAANKLINEARATGASSQDVAAAAADAQNFSDQLLSQGIDSLTAGAPRPAGNAATHTAGATIPSGVDAALANNQTAVTLRGSSFSEFSVGYGHPLPLPERFGQLGVGGNAKLIRGEVAFKKIRVVDGATAQTDDLISDFRDNRQSSVKPALDIGLLWRAPWRKRFQAGLVMRNLNSPSFDQPAAGVAAGEPSVTSDRQTRAGVAFWPLERLTLAADLDLSKNKTPVPGFDSRTYGLGAEFNILFFSLRAGLLKNFAASTPQSYTAGFGLSLAALKVDLGAVVSSKAVKVDAAGEKIPASFQVGLSTSLQFGGAPSKRKRKPKVENQN